MMHKHMSLYMGFRITVIFEPVWFTDINFRVVPKQYSLNEKISE